jgi:micrococcal nuclease
MKRYLLVVLLIFSYLIFPYPAFAHNLTEAYVIRTSHDDSINVRIGDEVRKIHLIGVKVLASREYDAEQFARSQLEGTTVFLEFKEISSSSQDRSWAYVWTALPADDSQEENRSKLFNARFLLDGYAQAETSLPKQKYEEWFREYEKDGFQKRRQTTHLNISGELKLEIKANKDR